MIWRFLQCLKNVLRFHFWFDVELARLLQEAQIF